MNCHRARMAIVERELGLLTLGFERGLDGHLAGCADCRAHAAGERMLAGELSALREIDHPTVEVRLRVMEQVREMPRVEPAWVPQGQLAWATAAAVAAAVGLTAWMGVRAAWLRDAAVDAADGTRAVLSAAHSTLGALKSLLVLPWRVAAALVEALAPTIDTIARLEPVAAVTITLGLVSMAVTIAWVVGNDLRRPVRASWRRER